MTDSPASPPDELLTKPLMGGPGGSPLASPVRHPVPSAGGRKASVSLQLFKATNSSSGVGVGSGGVLSDEEGGGGGGQGFNKLSAPTLNRKSRPRLTTDQQSSGSTCQYSTAASHGSPSGSFSRPSSAAISVGHSGTLSLISTSRPASPKTTPLAIYSSPSNQQSSTSSQQQQPTSHHLPLDLAPLGPPAIPLPKTTPTSRPQPHSLAQPTPLSPRKPTTATPAPTAWVRSSSESSEPSESSEWSLSSSEEEEGELHSDREAGSSEHELEDEVSIDDGTQDGFEFDLPSLAEGGKVSLSAGVAADQRGRTSAVPLEPYSHQVGGHSHIFRFSKRAVCKVSNTGLCTVSCGC